MDQDNPETTTERMGPPKLPGEKTASPSPADTPITNPQERQPSFTWDTLEIRGRH